MMLLVPYKSDPVWLPCRKKAKKKAKEKVVALRLASCARRTRAASLNLQRGLSGPALNSPVLGLRPSKILPPSARGGHAHSPLAGALCVCGQTQVGQQAFTRLVCTAWTARPWEAHTWTR